MHRVLITGAIHPFGLESLRAEKDLQIDYRPDLPLAELLTIIEPYHCLITRSETPVRRELLDRARNLKVVAVAAVGTAHVDIEYATEKGVLVFNTPGKNTNSAAELTLALLLDLVRKIHDAHETMRKGGWDRHRFTGTELLSKTIGIVGLGSVGHRVARFAHGFEMRVLACDPYIPDEAFARHRAEKTDLQTLVRESDIVSLHVPKNRETTGMIGPREIASMKKGVILLNAARGGIIDEPALLAALQSGQVAGAGIDTWSEEPPRDNPFRDLPNVVMTPHIGASTVEAQLRIAETIAVQVPRALRGGLVDAPVNMPQIRMLGGDAMVAYTVLCERLGTFAAQFLDFRPEQLQICYRGDIARQDCRLLRLAFLKGYLQQMSVEFVSYVNAEQRAKAVGLRVQDVEDPGFTDFESAVKFSFAASGPERGGGAAGHEFTIGGVVFGGPHPRITLVDGFGYEVEPEGTFLLIRCRDKMGVLSAISNVMDRHGILIHRLDFSHSRERRRTMFMFRVGQGIPDQAIEDLRATPHIRMVKKISI